MSANAPPNLAYSSVDHVLSSSNPASGACAFLSAASCCSTVRPLALAVSSSLCCLAALLPYSYSSLALAMSSAPL